VGNPQVLHRPSFFRTRKLVESCADLAIHVEGDMADAPKTIREVNFQVSGVEARMELLLKMIIAALGLLGGLLAAAVAVYVQIGDVKTETRIELAKLAQRLDTIGRDIAEAKTNDSRSLAALSRIENKLQGAPVNVPSAVVAAAVQPPLPAALAGPALTLASKPPDSPSPPAASPGIGGPLVPQDKSMQTGSAASPTSSNPLLVGPGLYLTAEQIRLVQDSVKRPPASKGSNYAIGDKVSESAVFNLPNNVSAIPALRGLRGTVDAEGAIVLVSASLAVVGIIRPR
jgi:hypothetical protein